jgi:hypothetical protein
LVLYKGKRNTITREATVRELSSKSLEKERNRGREMRKKKV